jgi:hypothetical protein
MQLHDGPFPIKMIPTSKGESSAMHTTGRPLLGMLLNPTANHRGHFCMLG